MFQFLGPFEKALLGLLTVLFGMYVILDQYFPAVFYPELNKTLDGLTISSEAAPRQGQIFPADPYSQFDPTQINYFAKGTDGHTYPSNAFLLKFKPFETSHYWLPMIALTLRVRYMRDDEIIPDDDTWQTSLQTYVRTWGDCEDHAILLADWLIELGYDAKVVLGTWNNKGHAWVILNKDGKEYLLESTDKASRRRFPLVSLHPEYRPVYMFNQNHFWVRIIENRGWRNRLAIENWVMLSDFKRISL